LCENSKSDFCWFLPDGYDTVIVNASSLFRVGAMRITSRAGVYCVCTRVFENTGTHYHAKNKSHTALDWFRSFGNKGDCLLNLFVFKNNDSGKTRWLRFSTQSIDLDASTLIVIYF
jgi:hypothetical protein